MKKIILSLVLSFSLISVANAATIFSDYSNNLDQNESRVLSPIEITASADNEITQEHGINIILDPDRYILWNDGSLTVTGSAVDNGKIESTISPTYLNNYKVLHIDIEEDLVSGEGFKLEGLRARTYTREIGQRFLGMDIDGDLIADVTDVNGYKVGTNLHTDAIIPYPIANLTYDINEDYSTVTLNWDNPPDYDFVSITVLRKITRDKVTGLQTTASSGTASDVFVDDNVQRWDTVEYEIYAHDKRNQGERVFLTVNVDTLPEEPEEEPVVEEEEEPTPEPATEDPEVARASKFYTYYKVRHEIKCRDESDRRCLWAKVDVAHSEALADKSDVGITFTEADLEKMRSRLRWPEMRYQTKCVEAETPADTCTALGRSLDRIHYFTDQ